MRETIDRRHMLMLGVVITGGFAMELTQARAASSKRLGPLRSIDAGVLNISYYEDGPADGPAGDHGSDQSVRPHSDRLILLRAQSPCRGQNGRRHDAGDQRRHRN